MINWKRFDKKNRLKYFSALQCCKENSSYGCRLSLSQGYALSDFLADDLNNTETISNILENGIPDLEDPQEDSFIGVVSSCTASYRVFLSNLEGYCHQLSRLLCMADVLQIDTIAIKKARFLLDLSDILAERYSCRRYELGCPKQEEITEPQNLDIGGVVFDIDSILPILHRCHLSLESLGDFVFKFEAQEILSNLYNKHFADCIERYPLLKLSDENYLVLQPSGLLKSAFLKSFASMKEELSSNVLYFQYNRFLSEIVRILVDKCKCNDIFKYEQDEHGIINLWGRFDVNKIANFVIFITETCELEECKEYQKRCMEKIQTSFPKFEITNFVIYDTLHPDDENQIVPTTKSSVWRIDDFEVAMKNVDYSLLELYYYHNALMKENYSNGFFQQLDFFAYYKENKSTFYIEQVHDFIFIEIGTALKMRSDYYDIQDYHIVHFRNDKYVGIEHFVELPDDMPIYTIRSTFNINIYIVEIEGKKISLRIEKDIPIYKEIMKSLLCLFIGFHRYVSQKILLKDAYIYLSKSEKEAEPALYRNIKTSNEYKYVLPEDFFKKEINEKSVFVSFIDLLMGEGVVSHTISLKQILNYVNSVKGGFLCYKETEDFLQIKNLQSCYILSENYLDRIMDELAVFLKWNKGRVLLSKNDSLKMLFKSLDYLENEIFSLLRTIDSEYFIDRLLDLYSTTIFWTRTSEMRFYKLNNAYKSIGSSFDKKSGFENKYVNTKILIQALIGWVVCRDFHGVGKCSLEQIDRLFALAHTYTTIGTYIDLLNGNIENSEFTMLENGRFAYPRDTMEKMNHFFTEMVNEVRLSYDTLKKKNSLIPEYVLDFNSESFRDAYQYEFGFDYQEYLDAIANSWKYAERYGLSVVVMFVDDFKAHILQHMDINHQERFLEKCVLSSNIQLNSKDNYVQQYNRESQLTSRPWVLFNGKVFYTANGLIESQVVISERFNLGRFSAKSEKMESLKAEICDNKGKHFTKSIAGLFSDTQNIEVYTEQNIKPGARLNSTHDIGDIDILIIDKFHKLVVCIEAKNYVECHTVYDVVSRIKGLKNEKVFEKVVKRDKWCKANILSFKKICSDVTDEYKVKTVFITNYSLFTYFLDTRNLYPEIHIMTALELIEHPERLFYTN